MAARWYYRNPNGDYVEIVDRIARVGWEVREQAEEGSAAMSTIVIDDPDMDFDMVGRLNIYVLEDSSEADDDVLFAGVIADQEIGRRGGEWEQPLARLWTVSMTDRNVFWQKRVMVGTDCNRPAETDVERVQWLLSTTEMDWAGDATTYVSTATPVDMDACDYRGQTSSQIMDDAAQASGKNWYCWMRRDGLGDLHNTVWYGDDSLAVYDSPLYLSNDPDDWTDAELADGTSLAWPISTDTKLRRDPSRVYSGVYLPYDGGAVYRQDADTSATFSFWDFIAPSFNVKSSAKAIARAERYLDELDEQDEVITTSVELPAAKATMLRAGMRVPFKATHLPGYEESSWCRVLSCSVTPIAAGERYRLTLELTNGRVQVAPTSSQIALVYTDEACDSGTKVYPRTCKFDYLGDAPPSGWVTVPTVGLLESFDCGDGYGGVTVLGDGTVSIEHKGGFAGVGDVSCAYVIVSLRVNGTAVASETYTQQDCAFEGYSDTNVYVRADGVAVENGDVIDVYVEIGNWAGDGPYYRVLGGSAGYSPSLKVWGDLVAP